VNVAFSTAAALLAGLVSWVLFAFLFRRYRLRGGLHNLLYSLGLFLFALAVSLEALALLQGAWAGLDYRLFYFAGAMHGVTFLGLGSLALANPRAARSLLWLLLPLILWGLYLVMSAPVDFSRLPEPYTPSGAAFPPAAWDSPRGWTFPFNLLGTALMLGVALQSTFRFWRENPSRARGTLVIALSALVLAGTSSLNRLGVVGVEELGRALGVSLLYLGVVLVDRGKRLSEAQE